MQFQALCKVLWQFTIAIPASRIDFTNLYHQSPPITLHDPAQANYTHPIPLCHYPPPTPFPSLNDKAMAPFLKKSEAYSRFGGNFPPIMIGRSR